MADRGVRAAGLKEISVAAGQRNNSAAQYYFGDRGGLVEAVFVHRMAGVNDTRREMLDALAHEPWDIRRLVEIDVGPLLGAMSLDEDSWFASFLVQAFADDEYRRLLGLDHPINRPTRTLIQLLARELSHLPARARRHRLEFAMITIVNLLAAYERAGRARRSLTYSRLSVLAEVSDAVVGLLRAPVSPAARGGRSARPVSLLMRD